MERHFLKYKDSKISYLDYGGDGELLLAYHGFSEDARMFQPIHEALSKKFRVVAFDFPYHGHTAWKEDWNYNIRSHREITETMLALLGEKEFSLMGYSMGGKMAMETVNLFEGRIKNLILIASDGIQTNKWFNMAVYPGWGRWLFKMFVNQPKLFFFFMNILRKRGKVSKFLHDFAKNHFDTKEKRKRLFDTWMSIKNFEPEIKEVKAKLEEYKIRTLLYFGKFDQVIPPSAGKRMAKDLSVAELEIIEGGHLIVNENLNQILKSKF